MKQVGMLPQVMVIHWGENDMGIRLVLFLLMEILQDVQVIQQYLQGFP